MPDIRTGRQVAPPNEDAVTFKFDASLTANLEGLEKAGDD